MNKARVTHLLLAVVAIMAITTIFAISRLTNAHDEALANEHDLSLLEAKLKDLAAWHVTSGISTGTDTNDPELNRHVRQAATAASLTDQILSIEPGPSVRVRDSDTLRTPIYLRLDGVTLRQVVTFIHGMMSSDAALRTTGVELSTPPVPDSSLQSTDEKWTADLTLSKSTIATTTKPPP